MWYKEGFFRVGAQGFFRVGCHSYLGVHLISVQTSFLRIATGRKAWPGTASHGKKQNILYPKSSDAFSSGSLTDSCPLLSEPRERHRHSDRKSRTERTVHRISSIQCTARSRLHPVAQTREQLVSCWKAVRLAREKPRNVSR